jgi:hypothetical protein
MRAVLGLAPFLEPEGTFYTLDEIARVTDRDKRLVNDGDLCGRNLRRNNGRATRDYGFPMVTR